MKKTLLKEFLYKTVPFFLIISCIIIPTPIQAFAKEVSNEKTTFAAEEITDLNVIHSRLISGITDDKSNNLKTTINFNDTSLYNGNEKKSILANENVKVTSQKVKESVNQETGNTTTDYVAYVSAEVSPMAISGGTLNPYDGDDSNSTLTYIKVTYRHNSFVRSNIVYELYKFDAIAADAINLGDSQVTVNKLVVTNEGSGNYYTDIDANNFVDRTYLTRTNTFTMPTDRTYYSIIPLNCFFNVYCGGSGVSYDWARSTTFCSRGGSSWNYSVTVKFSE